MSTDSLNNATVVTGMGVATSIGIGLEAFFEALRRSESSFSSVYFEQNGKTFSSPVSELSSFDFKGHSAFVVAY